LTNKEESTLLTAATTEVHDDGVLLAMEMKRDAVSVGVVDAPAQ